MRKAVYSFIAFIALVSTATAQSRPSFRKGSLLVSVTEGATFTRFTTYNRGAAATANRAPLTATTEGVNTGTRDVINDGNVNGDRDPLIIEYGVSNKVGLSLSMGGDVLNLNTGQYYDHSLPGKTKAITSEVTADVNYHFFTTPRVDLSAFFSLGIASVMLKEQNTEHSYSYEATGGLSRLGARARYYITRRFGIVGMASVFATSLSSKDVTNNTMGAGYDTQIRGAAVEFGPCWRILK